MKFSEGTQLAQDPLSGCMVVRHHVQHMWLSPRYLNGRIRSGVKELLEKQTGKYDESLDGVRLAYSNVKVMQRASFLLYDSVDMHFDVQYDVVIFRVYPGTLLKCTVNKVSADHLGCLIHKVINVSVPVPAWNFDPNQVKGQEIVCKVTKVAYKKGVLGVFGELSDDSFSSFQEKFEASEETNNDYEDMDTRQNNNTVDLWTGKKEKKRKKSKQKVSENYEQHEESFSNTSQSQNDSVFTSSLNIEENSDNYNSDRPISDGDCTDSKLKKKKKHKHKETDEYGKQSDDSVTVEILQEDLDVKDEERRKKKRKRHREDVNEDCEDFNDSGINGSLSDGHFDGKESLHNGGLNGSPKKHKKKSKRKKMSDD